jgi:hypothetical protein
LAGTILISALWAGLFTVAIHYASDVVNEIKKDGFQVEDIVNPVKENWKEYIVKGLSAAVIGAAWGTGLGLGAQAAAAGVRIACGKALVGLGITTIGSSLSGMGIYCLKTKVFGLEEYKQEDLLKEGLRFGLKGAANYAMGLLIGNQGFKGGEYSGIRGMVTRMYLKNSILTPFQWIFDGIMDSMW